MPAVIRARSTYASAVDSQNAADVGLVPHLPRLDPALHASGQRADEQLPVRRIARRHEPPRRDAGVQRLLIARRRRPARHTEEHAEHLDPVGAEGVDPVLERGRVEPRGIGQIGPRGPCVDPPVEREADPADTEPPHLGGDLVRLVSLGVVRQDEVADARAPPRERCRRAEAPLPSTGRSPCPASCARAPSRFTVKYPRRRPRMANSRVTLPPGCSFTAIVSRPALAPYASTACTRSRPWKASSGLAVTVTASTGDSPATKTLPKCADSIATVGSARAEPAHSTTSVPRAAQSHASPPGLGVRGAVTACGRRSPARSRSRRSRSRPPSGDGSRTSRSSPRWRLPSP